MEQKTYEWFVLRVGKITGTLAKKVHGAEWRLLIYKLIEEENNGYIEEDNYESDEMIWGSMNEPNVAILREQKLGIKLLDAGFLQNEEHQWIGYSPDKYYEDENGYVIEEFKCPSTAKHLQVIHLNEIPSKKDYWEAQCFHAFQLDERVHTVNFSCYDPRHLAKEIITITLLRKDYEARISKELQMLLKFRAEWEHVKSIVNF